MISRIIVIFVGLSIYYRCLCESDNSFRQEKAKVVYVNPKYLKDVTIFTFRRNRSSPYLTNCNTTLLQSFTKNFTIILKLGAADFQLSFKHCELLNESWTKDWLKTYTDVPLTCPTPVNTYHFKEIELPPKNFPIPKVLPTNTDYHVQFMYFLGKEKVLEMSIDLKFEKKKWKS